jgi:gentisate 1,2-dioxygenase
VPIEEPAEFLSATVIEQVPQKQSWEPIKVPAAAIEATFAKLEADDPSDIDRRESLIVHPQATAPGLGFSPGTDVTIGTLLPGERTRPRRQNSVSITRALSGKGTVHAAGREFAVVHQDFWALPSMRTEWLINDGDEPLRYLSYSNGPILRQLHTHYLELDPTTPDLPEAPSAFTQKVRRAKEDAPPIQITEEGALLLPYEHLVDPEVSDSRPILWPWSEVSKHLGLVDNLPQGYTGRPLLALYNPSTGTKNGATQSVFATFGASPANRAGTPHRHMSAAINYHIKGTGYSVVNGQRIDWGPGDLLLSAPAWSEHAHYMGDEVTWTLTIQDHPFHIGLDSLVWQEHVDGPVLTLGTESGFQTNLAAVRS